MPHDVTMPQLGMAQDAGKIVSWLKGPGEAVAKGDALFEVETDKATMEVEAQADGFLTSVRAKEGEDVPVGAVIARISDSAEDEAEPEEPATSPAPAASDDDLPEGHAITMPQLGMAQDTGLLVSWLKSPGDAVAATDVLFEVETDKSTMEVEAGRDGYLAATLAQPGEEVPVGAAVAILTPEAPDAPIARSVAQAAPAPSAPPEPAPAARATEPAPKPPAPTPTGGRILASPKLRRVAMEQGLDLARLVEAGHPQPFHMRDLDALKALPAKAKTSAAAPAAATRLTAHVASDGLSAFAAWAAEAHGLSDADALLAALAAASLPGHGTGPVAVERAGTTRTYAGASRALSDYTETEDAPALLVRDLRASRLRSAETGARDIPVITLTTEAGGLTLTLVCDPARLGEEDAIRLIDDFAGRMEQPLRHLL